MRAYRRQTRFTLPAASPAAALVDRDPLILGDLVAMGDQIHQAEGRSAARVVAELAASDEDHPSEAVGTLTVRMRFSPHIVSLYHSVLHAPAHHDEGLRALYARACLERVVAVHGAEAIRALGCPDADAAMPEAVEDSWDESAMAEPMESGEPESRTDDRPAVPDFSGLFGPAGR